MPKIELSKPAREAMAEALKRYLRDELDVDIEPFDAVLLVDFITQRFGPQIYNQGLDDAQTVLRAKLDAITEAIAELEKPLPR